MTEMTLDTIAAAVGGRLVGRRLVGCKGVSVSRVSTDTRKLTPGDLFVALRGDRFDAHDKIRDADTASAVIVERQVELDVPQIIVADTRRALGALAAAHRQTLGGTVIAVAGSNGKTGTKLLINGVLRTRLKGTASPASFNNDIGVPLTLLNADAGDDYVIVECGTNHPGEIARLREIALPDVAVVTSIGHEHLEGLADLDGVRRENLNIIAGVPTLIINGDDEPFIELCKTRRAFLPYTSADVSDVDVTATGTAFTYDSRPWHVTQLGTHSAVNAVAAILVGRHLGLDDDAIAAGLASADVPDKRLNLRSVGGVTIIDDTYNANPESVAAGLMLLKSLPCDGRRVVVLGDMLELGDDAARLHDEAVQAAARAGDMIIGVGPLTADCKGCDIAFDNSADAAAHMAQILKPNDLVYLKASRGTQLERVVDALTR